MPIGSSGLTTVRLIQQMSVSPRIAELVNTSKLIGSVAKGSEQLYNGGRVDAGPTYHPLSSYTRALLDVDKQCDDNGVFFYEYRGLLNSRLSSLVTRLTNALTSDLDQSLAKSTLWESAGLNPKGTAMQGDTVADPGAGRTSGNFFSLWGIMTSDNCNDGLNQQVDSNDTDKEAGIGDLASVALGGKTITKGTTGLQTSIASEIMDSNGNYIQQNTILDTLKVNLLVNKEPLDSTAYARDITDGVQRIIGNNYTSFKQDKGAPTGAGLYLNSELGVSPNMQTKRKVSNKFQAVLAEALANPENKDMLRWGLLSDVTIAATSTTATGSQVTCSLILDGRRDLSYAQGWGYVDVQLERFSAFYHS